MREFKRKLSERRPLKLARGADGRLRSATDVHGDIGAIWAEQRRMQLKRAIEEDKRKAARAAARKEFLKNLFRRKKATGKIKSRQGKAKNTDKSIEVKIVLPSKISLPKLSRPKLPKMRKKYYVVAVMVIGAGVLSYASIQFFSKRRTTENVQKPIQSQILGAEKQQPQYTTLLPAGKSIKELGGWGRVSPPDKDPVYAYVDTVSGIQINVSQQPLPERFRHNAEGELESLAEQFNAGERVTASDEVTVYIGTSIKGPQSIVFIKSELLVLIKSSSALTKEQWVAYVDSLQ